MEQELMARLLTKDKKNQLRLWKQLKVTQIPPEVTTAKSVNGLYPLYSCGLTA